MTQTLRPMTLGEILDRTFQIYRSRFVVFFGIALLPALVMLVVNLASTSWILYHPLQGRIIIFHKSFASLLWTLVLWLANGFFYLLARSGFVRATAGWIAGSRPSLHDCLSVVTRRWKSVLALDLFEQAAVILVPGGGFILGALAIAFFHQSASQSLVNNVVSALAGMALLIAAAVLYAWLGICLSLSFPALLAEDVGWYEAVKRSWRLVRRSFARVLSMWILLVVLTGVVNLSLRWLAYFILSAARLEWMGWGHGLPYFAVYSLIATTIATLVGPIYPIAVTLIYYDQRIRREGYDIEWMMRAAGLNAPEIAPAVAEPGAPVPVSAAPLRVEDGPA